MFFRRTEQEREVGSMFEEIALKPIGKVISSREEIKDDHWGQVEAFIEVDHAQFTEEVFYGLKDFSHVEVIYYFHEVSPKKIITTARHPRNNLHWPKVGIFSQRAKNRPNRIGLTTCELLEVKGLTIKVRGLDAIKGTPILDIKPYMKEFGPRVEISQPEWATELMKDYFK